MIGQVDTSTNVPPDFDVAAAMADAVAAGQKRMNQQAKLAGDVEVERLIEWKRDWANYKDRQTYIPQWVFAHVVPVPQDMYPLYNHAFLRIRLPGFPDITFRLKDHIFTVYSAGVAWDEEDGIWWAKEVQIDTAWTFEEACAIAAACAPAYTVVLAEIERRNDEGVTPPPPPAPTPDLIDQAVTLLQKFSAGEALTMGDPDIFDQNDAVAVLATVGLAVAEQLRHIAEAIEEDKDED